MWLAQGMVRNLLLALRYACELLLLLLVLIQSGDRLKLVKFLGGGRLVATGAAAANLGPDMVLDVPTLGQWRVGVEVNAEAVVGQILIWVCRAVIIHTYNYIHLV